jgi:hypothetical protein
MDAVIESEIDFEAAMEAVAPSATSEREYTDEEKLACSLENPEYCEACQ